MQAVQDVKSRKRKPGHPTQMASPNKFCSLPAVQAGSRQQWTPNFGRRVRTDARQAAI